MALSPLSSFVFSPAVRRLELFTSLFETINFSPVSSISLPCSFFISFSCMMLPILPSQVNHSIFFWYVSIHFPACIESSTISIFHAFDRVDTYEKNRQTYTTLLPHIASQHRSFYTHFNSVWRIFISRPTTTVGSSSSLCFVYYFRVMVIHARTHKTYTFMCHIHV